MIVTRTEIILAIMVIASLSMPVFCQQTTEEWVEKGDTLSDQGKYDEAIKTYDEAIALDSNYVEAWYKKGIAFNASGKYDEAILAYDEAIYSYNRSTWQGPDLEWIFLNKGLALAAQGKYEDAVQAYDEAITLDSEYVDAWNNKAIALNALGKYDEATLAYDEAILAYNRSCSQDLELEQLWNNKGLALAAQGKYEDAIQAYDMAIMLDANYVDAWNNKYILLENLKTKSPEKDLELAKRWNNDGLAHLAKGEYDKAIQCFIRAIELYPGNYEDAQKNLDKAENMKKTADGQHDQSLAMF